MSVIKKTFRYLRESDYRFEVNRAHGLCDTMPDEEYLKRLFKIKLGYDLDLDNPRTFNEKLQWLKLYDRKPIYTTMVDKYAVKDYVASIIGDEYIIPTLGVWDCFDEIDFDSLPDQFVLKCTHDSGGLVICRDKAKLNIPEARVKINKSLKRNYFYYGREWPYKNVKPRIIAEQYMEDSNDRELRDYKFFCFGGVAKCYKVDFDRFFEHRANYFTSDGKVMRLGEEVCPPDFKKKIECPANLEKIKQFAETLSKTHPFLRTDFYDVDGKVYFGELTFYPASGLGKFIYEGNDEMLGSWIQLPGSPGGYALIVENVVLLFNPKYRIQTYGGTPLRDYKIYTINGKAEMCMINQDRGMHTKADYFDRDYDWLDFIWGYDHAGSVPEKPKNYELMYDLAEKLAIGTTEVRVDFYEVNGIVYFGELTFFDGSGFDKIEPIEWDYRLGSKLKLPGI